MSLGITQGLELLVQELQRELALVFGVFTLTCLADDFCGPSDDGLRGTDVLCHSLHHGIGPIVTELGLEMLTAVLGRRYVKPNAVVETPDICRVEVLDRIANPDRWHPIAF